MNRQATIEADVICPDWTATVARQFGLSADRATLLRVSDDDSYAASDGRRTIVIRLMRPWPMPLAKRLMQQKAAARLHEAGAPIARPLRQAGSERLTVAIRTPAGLRSACASEWVDGRNATNSVEDAAMLGAALAEFHEIAAHTRFPNVTPHNLDDFSHPLRALREIPAARPSLGSLSAVARRLFAELREVTASGLRQVYCHGDAHAGNARVREGGVTWLDLERSGWGTAAADQGPFLWDAIARRKHEPCEARIAAFLSGYRSRRPLSGRDVKAALLFAGVRSFWLLDYHAKRSRTWGDRWFETGYAYELAAAADAAMEIAGDYRAY